MHKEIFQYAIEQMAAVPAASDVLARYTDRVKTNPVAYNMHGLLLEKQGLHREARRAFEKAVTVLEKNGDKEKLEQARVNYARVLGEIGQTNESITQYKKLGNLGTVENLCGLALVLCRAGKYKESMEMYEKALTLASKDDKGHIQASLGMVAYRAGDTEMAKAALFKCSQILPVSIAGLQALLSLGLLQSDATLAAAVLQELDKLGAMDVGDLAMLTACLHVLKVGITQQNFH